MRISLNTYFLSLLFLLFSFSGFAQYDIPEVPKKQKAVYDYAEIMKEAQVMQLRKKLESYADSTSTQIVFVSVNSLKGEEINLLAAEWAHKWKIGQEGKDNGMIILMAKRDQQISIQNGYGLEPFLTDMNSSAIINQIILPEFRKANYYEGLDKGTDAIIQLLNGKFDAQAHQAESGDVRWSFLIFPFIILIVIIIIKSRGKGGGSGGGSGNRRGGPDLFDILVLSSLGRSGGFGGGSFGGSSGGGFGGGGFSGGFGGGGFGGGGASGSW